jgi:signal transduction histidine kinase/HAMP domain-containing protein
MSTPNLFPSQVSEQKTTGPARFWANGLSNIPIAWKMGLIVLMLSLVTLSVAGIAGFGLQTMYNQFADISNGAALTAYNQAILNTGLALLIGLLLSLILSYLIVNSITVRLNGLTRSAYALQEGDFDQKGTITGRDEIGLLGSIFLKMGTQLKDLFDSQEQRVEERTHDLELASEVGRAMTEKVANLSELLSQAAELIRSRFDLYYTQIYMADSSGHNLNLQAGTGHVGHELLRRRHHLPISSGSLNGRAAADRTALIVADTLKSGSFLPNPLLPLTRSEMAVPLIANGKILGVLDMQSERPNTFRESNLPAFQVLAGQLAIAIQNAALFQQAEEARLEVEAQANRLTTAGWQEFLNAVDRSENIGYVYNQNEVQPLVEARGFVSENTLAVPIEISGARVGEVRLADEANRQWTASEAQVVHTIVARVAQHIENLRLLAQAERYRAEAEQVSRRLTSQGWNEYLKTRHELASGYIYDQNQVQPLNKYGHDAVSLPAISHSLIVHDQTIGELIVNADAKDGAHAADIVTAVAQQLSEHIENLRLLEQAEQRRVQADGLTQELAQRANQLETVATLSTTASTVLDPDKLLQDVVDLTKERFDLYHAHIYLIGEAGILLLANGAGEIGRQMVAEQHAILVNEEYSQIAHAAREQKAIIINDVQSQPGFLPNPLLPDTRSEMAVPMIIGDKVIGVFDVQSNNLNGFSKEDASVYTTLAAQVAVALQNARLYVEQAATVTQLRELDRLKSSFLANMSHELRTPLNSILGFADVMLEGLDGDLTPNMDNDLGLIRKNGQHLLNLINDVLDMAKIESGTMSLNPEKFRVYEILDEVTSITSSLASEKNIALFITDDSDREVEIYADRTRLRQVMINLVNNSIKFTDKGKISIHAKLLEGEKVLITVKDTGIGIPPDKLEAVFQEFTQVDISSTRKVGGTGLGLPISRKLVEMHGGHLWAESTGIYGEGSTFYVEMPLEAQVVEK